jgi:hypothetical protein
MNNNVRVSTSNNQSYIGVLAMALVINPAAATTADNASVRFVPYVDTLQNLSHCVSDVTGEITNCLPVSKAVTPSVTVHDIIMQSQNILGIGKLHLAAIFKMSRQNLDNLIKNTEQKPTPETETRVLQVKEALEVISGLCPYKLGASTMTCKINGRRLLDELSNNEINLAEVRLFAQEITKRIQVSHQSNLPESVIKNQEFMDTFNS